MKIQIIKPNGSLYQELDYDDNFNDRFIELLPIFNFARIRKTQSLMICKCREEFENLDFYDAVIGEEYHYKITKSTFLSILDLAKYFNKSYADICRVIKAIQPKIKHYEDSDMYNVGDISDFIKHFNETYIPLRHCIEDLGYIITPNGFRKVVSLFPTVSRAHTVYIHKKCLPELKLYVKANMSKVKMSG